jgi:hypothetical protein
MRLMNLSEIMDRAIVILRKNIKSIALFSFGYGVIAFIGIIIVGIIGTIIGLITAAISKNVVLSIIIVSVLVLFIVAFIFSYYIGIIKISSQEFIKEEVFAHTAIKASFKSIFKVFVIVIIAFIIFVPVIAAFGGVGYILVKTFDATNIKYGLFKGTEITIAILSLLYILAAMFASVALLTWFSFSLHSLIIEKISIIKSIKKSFYLVRKEYWKVFGANVIFILTVAALRLSADLLLSTASSFIYLVLKLINFKQDYFTFLSTIYSYANWPLSIVLMMVITPIGTIMLTMLYFNQRFKKEGFDLELRLKEIEIKEERKQLSETAQFNGSI